MVNNTSVTLSKKLRTLDFLSFRIVGVVVNGKQGAIFILNPHTLSKGIVITE